MTKEIRIQRWPDIHAAMVALGGFGTSRQIAERAGISQKNVTCYLGQYVSTGKVFRYGSGHLHKTYSLTPLDQEQFGGFRKTQDRPAPGRERAYGLIKDAGADGIDKEALAAVCGVKPDAFDKHLCVLRRQGRVLSVKYLKTARHFANKEHAEAFTAVAAQLTEDARKEWQRNAIKRKRDARAAASAARPPKVRQPKAPKPRKREPRPGRELLAGGTRSVERPSPTGPVVIPENVKRTVCPSPPGRFDVVGPVIGGFATQGIGRYGESRAWSRAVSVACRNGESSSGAIG